MSKRAEEKAREYASNCMLTVNHEGDVYDAFLEGYEQAEKDLALRDGKQETLSGA